MNTYFGYTKRMPFDELARKFDIDYEIDPDGCSFFMSEFEFDYVDSGSFEIYDRSEYNNQLFDLELIRRLLPFALPDNASWNGLDLSKVQCVFFVVNPAKVELRTVGDIVLTDRYEGDLSEPV